MIWLLACVPMEPEPPVLAVATQPAPAAQGTRAILLSGAPIFEDLTYASARVGRVEAGDVVRVLAQTTYVQGTKDAWEVGYPLSLVEHQGVVGWVDGEHIALEQTWGASEGWQGELISARTVGDSAWWPAAQVGLAWSDSFEGWDRPDSTGWWVRQGPDGTERIPMVRSNGWGSEVRVEQVIWRDLTGDGVDEALITTLETVMEAGSAGSTLTIHDLTRRPMEPLLSIPLHDPLWSGLDVVDAWGWGELDLPDQELRQIWVQRRACDDGVEACLSVERRSWSWESGALVPGEPVSEGLSGVLQPGPLRPVRPEWGQQPATAALMVLTPKSACVVRTHGPVGVGDVFWLQVDDCQGSLLGWVESTQMRFYPSAVDEVLGPWPDQPSPALRVTWK